MKIIKLIKYGLFLWLVYFLFPTFNNGVLTYILKFIFYLLLLLIGNAIINDSINYLVKNWSKAYLRWIDEREHIKGNTLANLSRLDFVGVVFRTIHYFRFNKKRLFQELYFNIKENFRVYFTFFLITIIIIGFLIYNIFIK